MHSFSDDSTMHIHSEEMISLPTIDDYDESYILYGRGYIGGSKDIFTPDINYDLNESDSNFAFPWSHWNIVVYEYYNEVRRITELANAVLAVKKGMETASNSYRDAYNDYLSGGYVFADGTAYAKKDIDDLLNNHIQKAIECLDTIYCGLCKLYIDEREKLNIARHRCRLAHNYGMGDSEYDDF